VATLKSNDDVGPFRQPIDNLALALVTPLGAHNHDVRHLVPSHKHAKAPAHARALAHYNPFDAI
jgi:hypothetical protein